MDYFVFIHYTRLTEAPLTTITTTATTAPTDELKNNEILSKIQISEATIQVTVPTVEKVAFYDFFQQKLNEILRKRIDKLSNADPLKAKYANIDLDALIASINEQVLLQTNPSGDAPKKYYNRMSKIKQMLDPEYTVNQSFYLKILSGTLTPESLAKMSDEDLQLVNEKELEKINLEEIIQSVAVGLDEEQQAEACTDKVISENGVLENGSAAVSMTSQGTDSDDETPLDVLSKTFLNKYVYYFYYRFSFGLRMTLVFYVSG